jgi:hypothetical protein
MIPFCDGEINEMRNNYEEMSYGEIAALLNSKYHDRNQGKRTRQVVYQFLQSDTEKPVRRQIKLPRKINDMLRDRGLSPEQVIISALTKPIQQEPRHQKHPGKSS